MPNTVVLTCARSVDGRSDTPAGGNWIKTFPFSHGILEFQAMVAAGKQADIVAMPGDPLADTAATGCVDFVMRAGRIYRHQSIDVFQS